MADPFQVIVCTEALRPGVTLTGLTAACRDDIDIASGERLIAHDAGDVRDSPAIPDQRGEATCSGGLTQRGERTALRIEQIELGDPPVVIARSVRRGNHESPAVGRPVKLVDVEIRRADQNGISPPRAEMVAKTLLVDGGGEYAGIARQAD